MSNKDDFAIWFENNNLGNDMWGDLRECHKKITKLETLVRELVETVDFYADASHDDILDYHGRYNANDKARQAQQLPGYEEYSNGK